jgi:APA family basic amino acid/polyamine antiporter
LKEQALTRRFLGVPLLFAVGYAAVGFSLYFSIGVVADLGMGLTPLVFLAAGLLFVLATLSYMEGGAMFLERGGSSTLARYGFNELVSFIAGWALLIDYVIVISIAAVSVPHYLSPLSDSFTHGWLEIAGAAAVISFATFVNVAGFTGRARQGALVALAMADLGLQVAVIAIGAVVAMHPDLLTAHLDLFTTPSARDLVAALAVATIAFAGIEAASDLAPDLEWTPKDLRRVVGASAVLLPLIYAGTAAIALMAVPVEPGAHGPETQLARQYIEEPILGVVKAYDPAWLSDMLQVAVVIVAPAVLTWAASASMLGLSRHMYALATNRQVPSWLGRLGQRETPYVAIGAAAVIAFGLAIPGDIRFLAGLYAFGATLAITIAHLAIVRLRIRYPDRERPFRIGWNVRWRGNDLPLPAILGAVLMGLAWLSVIVFRERARWVGGGWMVFGIVAYIVYRQVVERTSITKRVEVPAQALKKEVHETEYASILVPIFNTELDDDIVGTAGRLADAADEPGEQPPHLDVIYVMEMPLTVPLDAPVAGRRQDEAERALERAREVGEEYETVEVHTDIVRARSVGAGIVEEARRRGVEAIVMGAEPPSRVRGGAVLGGVGGSRARPKEIGEVTEYVLEKAPCPVLLTAAPAD